MERLLGVGQVPFWREEPEGLSWFTRGVLLTDTEGEVGEPFPSRHLSATINLGAEYTALVFVLDGEEVRVFFLDELRGTFSRPVLRRWLSEPLAGRSIAAGESGLRNHERGLVFRWSKISPDLDVPRRLVTELRTLCVTKRSAGEGFAWHCSFH